MNKPTKPATIIDVAQYAKLSPTTVSRVVNNSGYFSLDTKQKVAEAVDALGYRPNWSARSLQGKPSRLVGLIIPDISNNFYTMLAASVSRLLEENGYQTILCINDENPEKDLGFLKILDEKRVDGILYTHPSMGSNSDIVHKLVERGMPILELNRQRENGMLDAVLADNFRAAQQAVQYLLDLGHRRIAIITGESTISTGAERLAGYKSTILNAEIPLDLDLIKVGAFSRQFGEESADQLLQLANPPTAIFAASNRIMLGVLAALNARHVQVPDELSVLAFDDAEWMSVWNPPITAVDVAIEEMAALAMDLLARRIHQGTAVAKPVTYQLSTNLVIRQSCKKVNAL